ncbi:MAG: hypothetical protein AB1529_04905 [Candidatus Micrarchaeota archaeon]
MSKVSYPREKRLKEEGMDSYSSVSYARNQRTRQFGKSLLEGSKS